MRNIELRKTPAILGCRPGGFPVSVPNVKGTIKTRLVYRFIGALLVVSGLWNSTGRATEPKYAVPDKGTLHLSPCDTARFQFEGVLGERIKANTANWLLCAPQANPGMLEMFRVRDRQPVPQIVPWAGEFVGKYLIPAIQALRMSEDAVLRIQVSNVVAELITLQADDGYLGPFPKSSRLKGNWDLWGHYHVMQALMLWHEATGDPTALLACRRAGDLICATFLDTNLRVYDAGSHEMNMAVIHGLGQLHRLTGEPRYLRMMREIEKDWERAGNYFRSGLAGVEFFQSPRPRWESLHDLQGLVELYQITGDARYRQAFEQHWRSIARWDRHNTGGFSAGEQATGNPYSPDAIETCCTVAWMVLTTDMLRLTGDPRCADELELSTFNGGIGAQHPSGRWWTYSTPMNGVREASAHSIVFQSRAGTPELNCCSVNAPRVLGVLSEWGVMTDEAGLVINYFGPGTFTGKLRDGTPVSIRWETDYPHSGIVVLHVEPQAPADFRLSVRVPAWSKQTGAEVNGAPLADVNPGHYLPIQRRWAKGDRLRLEFDMAVRFVTGDRQVAGKVSLYRGPLLLAYDQHYNSFDEDAIPALNLSRLKEWKLVSHADKQASTQDLLKPWVLMEVPAQGGQSVRLCDFASAGATGTRYRSWLTAQNCPPPPIVTRLPRDGGVIGTGPVLFRWTGPNRTNELVTEYQLLISEEPTLTQPVVKLTGLHANRVVMEETTLKQLKSNQPYFWQVVAMNAHGKTEGIQPFARFSIDSTKPSTPITLSLPGPDSLLVKADLRGTVEPEYGKLMPGAGTHFSAVAGVNGQAGQAIQLDGKSQKLGYELDEFPEEDYSVAVWVRIDSLPSGHIGQVFSAWTANMDDPLRLCVDGGKVFARIEAGMGYGTSGLPIEVARWHHIAAVKSKDKLTLFIDGKPGPSITVPMYLQTKSREIALGGNPRYTGNEYLAATFSQFRMHERALSDVEIAQAAQQRE